VEDHGELLVAGVYLKKDGGAGAINFETFMARNRWQTQADRPPPPPTLN